MPTNKIIIIYSYSIDFFRVRNIILSLSELKILFNECENKVPQSFSC